MSKAWRRIREPDLQALSCRQPPGTRWSDEPLPGLPGSRNFLIGAGAWHTAEDPVASPAVGSLIKKRRKRMRKKKHKKMLRRTRHQRK